MADFYANAAVTLAAASSSNAQVDLFRHRQTQANLEDGGDDDVNSGATSSKSRSYHIREFSDDQFFNYQDFASAAEGRRGLPPLFQRAFIFQEHLLSRRVVFFTPLKLFWECLGHSDSESGYSWIGDGLTKQDLPLSLSSLQQNTPDPDTELTQLW